MSIIPNFLTETKLIEIFISVDDFRIFLSSSKQISYERKEREGLTKSEIMTIEIGYHLSGYKSFKYYYKDCIQGKYKSYFPQAPNYERFIQVQYDAVDELSLYLQGSCYKPSTTANYIDSTSISICDNKRIGQNKVFKGKAKKGHSSMGLFYGFKLHVIVNQKGELVFSSLTPGNVADNKQDLLFGFSSVVKGVFYGDKGYLSSMKQDLKEAGFELITKVRANMKPQSLSKEQAYYLRHRGLIESVFDTLKCFCNIEHSRYRNPKTIILNILTGLIAYSFCDNKPSIMPFINRLPLASKELTLAA